MRLRRSRPAGGGWQSWEQRYRSQQGRLEQAQKTNQQMNERLAPLENQLSRR